MRSPWLRLAIGLGLLVVALVAGLRLPIRSDLAALLAPEDPAAIELRRALRETGVASRLYVVLENEEPHGARACSDLVARRVRDVGKPVTSAESGVHAARAFLLPRALYFTSLPDLERARAALRAERERAVVREMLGGDIDEAPSGADLTALREATKASRGQAARFPDGYFEAPDGRSDVVVVTTSVPPSSLDESGDAIRTIRGVVDGARSAEACANVRIGYAGDLLTAFESYRVVRNDLLEVGTVGLSLVLLVLVLFFFRVRAVAALALALALGLASMFGIAMLVIGHLNVATGFLASIVAGNGINAGIVLVARAFAEARRGAPMHDAVEVAVQVTWRPTLGAAAASAAAYGSLALTDLRALVEFGVLGAEGMLATWGATYLVVPPLLVLWERRVPFGRARSRLRRHGIDFGALFAALVQRAPRGLAALWACIAVLGVVLGAAHVRRGIVDPDLRRVRSDLALDPEHARIVALASDVLGRSADTPVIVLAPSAERVPELLRVLAARRAGPRPAFGDAHSLAELVPDDLAAKGEIVSDIRKELLVARRHDAIPEATWKEIEPMLAASTPPPWSLDDLPDDVLPAVPRDVRSRLVVVEPAPGASEYDLEDLSRLADALREVRLDDGVVVRGTGRQMLFAELLRRTFDRLPRALAGSLVGTLIVILVTVRGARTREHSGALRAALVVLSLGVGLAGMALGMSVLDIRLNLFSVIAVPVAFGIGADYALNLVCAGDLRSGGRRTGGAVLVSSATTALGYSALVASVNPAIRSFGALSVLGEVACVGAAILALPALVLTVTGRSRRR